MRLVQITAVIGLALSVAASALAASAGSRLVPEGAGTLEKASLRSIAGWLRAHGAEGYLGADVADAMGIPRADRAGELAALQRGFRNGGVLRIAQVVAGAHRELLLFMVQRPDEQVVFYLSTPHEGLVKALVSIPGAKVVTPLERAEAEFGFRREVLYWEDKAATH